MYFLTIPGAIDSRPFFDFDSLDRAVAFYAASDREATISVHSVHADNRGDGLTDGERRAIAATIERARTAPKLRLVRVEGMR